MLVDTAQHLGIDLHHLQPGSSDARGQGPVFKLKHGSESSTTQGVRLEPGEPAVMQLTSPVYIAVHTGFTCTIRLQPGSALGAADTVLMRLAPYQGSQAALTLLYVASSQQLQLRWTDGSGVSPLRVDSLPVEPGAWQTLLFSVNTAQGKLALWQNGRSRSLAQEQARAAAHCFM